MADETRPAWAQRLAAERQARGWTQQQTVEALRMQADRPAARRRAPAAHVEELGARQAPPPARVPAAHRRRLRHASRRPSSGPTPRRPRVARVRPRGPGGDNTLELVERIRRSDLDRASLDTLSITVERLCSEYAYMPSADLRREGQAWMAKLVQLLDGRLTLAQHREVLVLAGWLALLVGCVEYDTRDVRVQPRPPARPPPASARRPATPRSWRGRRR